MELAELVAAEADEDDAHQHQEIDEKRTHEVRASGCGREGGRAPVGQQTRPQAIGKATRTSSTNGVRLSGSGDGELDGDGHGRGGHEG